MVFNVIALIIGLLIFSGGLYYLVKEKNDRESKKIYGIATAVGALIASGFIVKIIVEVAP